MYEKEVTKDLTIENLDEYGMKAEYLGEDWFTENKSVLPFEVRSWEKITSAIPLGMLLGVTCSDEDDNLSDTKKVFFKRAKSEHFSKACFVTVPSMSKDNRDNLNDALSVGVLISVLLSLDVNNSGYKSLVVNRDLTYQVYNAQKSPKKVVEVSKKPFIGKERSYASQAFPVASLPEASFQTSHEVNGEIKTFFVAKGFGFVISPDGTQTFFHINNVRDPELVEFLEASKPEEIQKRHIKVTCMRRKDAGEKYHTAMSVDPI